VLIQKSIGLGALIRDDLLLTVTTEGDHVYVDEDLYVSGRMDKRTSPDLLPLDSISHRFSWGPNLCNVPHDG